MADFLDLLDDPNDPGPEAELLEEWDRVFPTATAPKSPSGPAAHSSVMTLSEEGFLDRLGIKSLPDEPMEQGLPVPEYMKRYNAAMEAEDWQAIADLWHTKLDYSLIKALEQLKYSHELDS